MSLHRKQQTKQLIPAQSTYQAVLDIIKREGLAGLYSGLDSSLLGIAVTNGCVLVISYPRALLLLSVKGLLLLL